MEPEDFDAAATWTENRAVVAAGAADRSMGGVIAHLDAVDAAAAAVNGGAPIPDAPAPRPSRAESAAAVPPSPGKPAGVFMFDPAALRIDAQRFQFKEGGDAEGVTAALRSVTKWDPAKGNQVIIWQDRAGGLFVADGHQRAGLARRLLAQGKETQISLPGVLYREIDGFSASEVRAVAAAKNMAEGSGSALDGAKVLRAQPNLIDGSLPLSTGKARQAANLARLGDEPFRMVVNEVVPEHFGAIVGELLPNDPERQLAAIKALARFEARNEAEATALTQRVAAAELERAAEGRQMSMFGDLESADSTAQEEMRIVARAIADLKKDKSLFSRVVANAERIEAAGSTIARDAAFDVKQESDIFARRLGSEAYAAGPVREVLKTAARELRNEDITLADAAARIHAALRGAAEDLRAARPGAGAGGDAAGHSVAAAERRAGAGDGAGGDAAIGGGAGEDIARPADAAAAAEAKGPPKNPFRTEDGAALRADAERALAVSGEQDIHFLDENGAPQTMRAADMLREADDLARAAEELRLCMAFFAKGD